MQSRPLIAACVAQARAAAANAILLVTMTNELPAITTYLSIGFLPCSLAALDARASMAVRARETVRDHAALSRQLARIGDRDSAITFHSLPLAHPLQRTFSSRSLLERSPRKTNSERKKVCLQRDNACNSTKRQKKNAKFTNAAFARTKAALSSRAESHLRVSGRMFSSAVSRALTHRVLIAAVT